MVMMCADFKGHVFGAYLTDPWRLSEKFYGDGECFLFRSEPEVSV
jgi:hypothetical protein